MKLFRFSVSNGLVVTFWVALWFAFVAAGEPNSPLIIPPWLFLLVMAPAAACGALMDHPNVGILCGSASGAAVTLWAAIFRS